MAAALDTSEGGERRVDAVDEAVDYEAMLSATLEQHKVKHIADIVAEVEEQSLSDLLMYSHNDVVELLKDIDGDEDNEYKIKVSQRHKFAKAVIAVADQKKQALNEQAVADAANTSSQLKLLFLGKEEEEAIEAIQSGHKAMTQAASSVKRLFNALDGNHESVKAQLLATGEALKQRIDEKMQSVGSVVDGVYLFHLGALKQRDEVTQQAAKVVAKVCSPLCKLFDL